VSFLAGDCNFAIETLQGFVDLRHVGFEVYGFYGFRSRHRVADVVGLSS
jgi:hypothetical protein